LGDPSADVQSRNVTSTGNSLAGRRTGDNPIDLILGSINPRYASASASATSPV